MESKAVMNQAFVKLDRFDGTNFTRWKGKMMFLLTALKISYILNPALTDLSPPNSDEDEQTKKDRSKCKEDELLCRGHILNNLSDRLYDLFTSIKTAKEIWSALEFKYNNEKQGVYKFLIMKYFEFSMVDNVSVMDQVHKLQILVSKLKDVKVEVPESLQVGGIIAKLPRSWNGYVKKLLHTTETFSLEQIKKHLRIEEETRLRANKFSNESTTKVNFVDRTTVLNKIPILLNIEDDPKTFQEAMSSRDVAFWKEAINDEMDSLISNNTWIIVDLPPSSKPIGCKWVFRRKYNTDGSLQTFKARLVAKGFKQKEGINYFDTYAPMARITSIRVLLALASLYNLFVHQMDVETAFLNGELDEEDYMEQPEGFVLPGNERKVCKLTKSL